MSFWLKPRQIVIMDAQSSGPARNFSARYLTLLVLFLVVTVGSFVFGSWYAPFQDMQSVIPENMQLKRQNVDLQHQVADVQTLNDLKDEQLSSLKEQISLQETEIVNINNQLHMYKSILDQRKGTGVHVLESSATWNKKNIHWKALFVKGGSYPRYLKGKYEILVSDGGDKRVALTREKLRYKIESHIFMQQKFDWKESWQPVKLELVVYNSRSKEVLRKIIPIEGK